MMSTKSWTCSHFEKQFQNLREDEKVRLSTGKRWILRIMIKEAGRHQEGSSW